MNDDEKAKNPEAVCCTAAPPVMEFDAAGNYIQGWGGEAAEYEWPKDEHSIHVDYKGNVWISSAGGPRLRERTENQILKFTQAGKFLFQVGHRGKSKGSLDTDNFNNAADIYVYPKTNEVFVADGYVNRRVIVLDGDNIFLQGNGPSTAGDHPFLTRYNLATKESKQLFKCDDDHYEIFDGLLDAHGDKFLTRRESPTEVPNYYVRTSAGQSTAITKFPDPQPIMRKIKKELVT